MISRRRLLTEVQLDVLAALVQALKNDRGHSVTLLDVARRRLEALRGAQAAVEAAGERFGAIVLDVLVDDQEKAVEALERPARPSGGVGGAENGGLAE